MDSIENKENKTGVLSVPGVLKTGQLDVVQESTGLRHIEIKKRLCSVECANFDKPTCSAPNWGNLNKQSEMPVCCPGYSYVGAGEAA